MNLIDKFEKNKILNIISISFLIIALSLIIYFKYDSSKLVVLACLLLNIINFLRYKYLDQMKKIFNKIIDYRYFVAVIIFIFCVIFKLHGSSIGVYNDYFVTNISDTSIRYEIFGKGRPIRSDEWSVQTAYYLSQHYNDYKLDSNMMSLSGQNMIIGYNSPVKNITMIGKPLTWGYLLFGNEYGLSWYWCLKLIILMLASFELCMIITKKNRYISIVGMMMLAFSPVFQWWFCPHITDVFLWGMSLLVVGYHFFTANNKKMKIITTILAFMVVISFVLALFPSCQIPVGIISLVLLIIFLIRDKDNITFTKKEWYRIAIAVLVVAITLGYFIYTSFNDIILLYSTVYPGKRVSLGGDSVIYTLFTNLSTIFLPYQESNVLNNCEVSTFIHFAPIFLIMYPFIIKNCRKDNNKIVGKALLIILIFEIVFMLAGFPERLAKLTLFSYINRMNIVYGFTAVLFTIWSISTIWNNKIKFSLKQILFYSGLYGFCYLMFISKTDLDYMPLYRYILEILVFCFIIVFILNHNKKLALTSILFLIGMASFTINPISTGISPITNHPISKEITDIIKNDESYWLSINNEKMANFLISNGAKTLNAVNFYPDYDKWKLVDDNLDNDFYYNRYAHINVYLTDDKTSFDSDFPDVVQVNITVDDIKKWNVKYLLSDGDISDNLKNIDYEILYSDNINSFIIYKLKY